MVIKKLLFIIFSVWLLGTTSLQAAFERKAVGVSQLAMGYAGIASSNGSFALFHNPALLAGIPAKEIVLFYRNYYGIRQLNHSVLHYSMLVAGWPIGVAVSQFGHKLYTETEIRTGSAFHISEKVVAGISLNLYHLNIERYGSASALGASLALIYQINEDWRVAAVVDNLNEPRMGDSKERLPPNGMIAIAFRPIDLLEINADLYKEDIYNFEYRMGVRLSVFDSMNILAGFRETVNTFSAGLEYNTGFIRVKYGLEVHPVLNLSHALEVGLAF